MQGGRLPPRLASARKGNEWHVPQNRLSLIAPPSKYASLRRHRDKMKWRDLLRVSKSHHQARSGTRSEGGSLKSPSGVNLVVRRPTESTPDLRIGTSALPMSSPLAPRDQEPKGEQTIISRTIHLTALFAQNRSPPGFRSNPIRSRKRSNRGQPPKIPRLYCRPNSHI